MFIVQNPSFKYTQFNLIICKVYICICLACCIKPFQMDIYNLQGKLNYEVSAQNVKIVKKLKFQNLIYSVGDSIRVRSDIKSDKDLFAKILSIILAKNITPFPLLYVAWYEESDNQIISTLSASDLRAKQIILTDQKDWQYIEAVKGKIQVVSESQFRRKDGKQQEKNNLFFCRSYFTKNKQFIIESRKHCYCQKIYLPQNPLIMCQICKVLYHPSCANGREDRCIKCVY